MSLMSDSPAIKPMPTAQSPSSPSDQPPRTPPIRPTPEQLDRGDDSAAEREERHTPHNPARYVVRHVSHLAEEQLIAGVADRDQQQGVEQDDDLRHTDLKVAYVVRTLTSADHVLAQSIASDN